MAKYVAAERLTQAVDRLRQSRASGGMVNFLILKRAISLAPAAKINLSTRDEHFQQAITDLTWWPADAEDADSRPFIDVFGSTKAKNNGMKKQKYRSNGPADTLKNGAWGPVVKIEAGDRSKSATLTDNYPQGLAALTLLKDEQRPMPLLGDAAVWYFRRRDVATIVADATTTADVEARLGQAFREELGLSEADIETLFAQEDDNAA